MFGIDTELNGAVSTLVKEPPDKENPLFSCDTVVLLIQPLP